MKIKKPILIVLGEPNSVFIEILSKVVNKKSVKKKMNYPIILIGSHDLIISQLKILKRNIKLEIISDKNIDKKLKNKIYLININYKFKKAFEKISSKSKNYISAYNNILILSFFIHITYC